MKRFTKIISMPLLAFIFLTIMTLPGCDGNKYEIHTTIKPKVLAKSTNNLSIEYTLGPCLILDDLEDIKVAQRLYIDNNKNDLELDLKVIYADVNTNENGFYYSLAGNELTQTKPIDSKKLMKYSDEIAGFKWIIKNGIEMKDDGEISREVKPEEKKNKIKRL